MKIRRSLMQQLVIVTTRTGDGAYGPAYDDPRQVECMIDETRRLVRDSAGDETVSEATLTLHPVTRVLDDTHHVVDHVDPLEVFTPESPVTINGRSSRVLSAKANVVRSSVVSVEVTCA